MILVPQTGIKPCPLQWKHGVLNHWTPREVLCVFDPCQLSVYQVVLHYDFDIHFPGSVPILQKRKLRLREVKNLPWGPETVMGRGRILSQALSLP